MFLFLKKFYYLKKAKKPLDMLNKYSIKIIRNLSISENNYSIAYFHAWLHVLYCIILDASEKLELTISLFLKSHLSCFMTDFEASNIMDLRYVFIKNILGQIENFINEPAFIPMMAEIATNFLLEENLITEENRDKIIDQLVHYEFLFIEEIK